MLLIMFLFGVTLGKMDDYDFLDQVAAIKQIHPNLKHLGVVGDAKDLGSIKVALEQLPSQLTVLGHTIPLNDHVISRPDLYARQAIKETLDAHPIDCILVFTSRGKALDDIATLKSIARLCKDRNIPCYAAHAQAKRFGYTGRLVLKDQAWTIKGIKKETPVPKP